MILRIIFICLLLATLTGCPTMQINKEAAWRNELIKTDEDFSDSSQKAGMKKAFIEFMDSDAVLLRANHPPIIRGDAFEFIKQSNDSTYTLTWKPSGSQVAASGDIGYTYGVYNLQLKDTTLQGTYVSIWKKQKDEKWKFVLDTGNPGVTPADKSQ